MKAIELAVAVHGLTKRMPKNSGDGLASHLRRAAASIPANIAEGHGRNQPGEYLDHLSIANGSLTELETHVCLAERLATLKPEPARAMLGCTAEISRMLAGLTKALRATKPGSRPSSGVVPQAPST